MARFSVVIPTKDRAGKVVRAVRSVAAQTYRDYEVIVVDDGTDDTERQLAEAQSSVKYVRGEGRGVAAGRNLGIRIATGPYVAFLDADDVWRPSKLERLAAAIAADRDGGLFVSPIEYVDSDGRVLWRTRIDASSVAQGYHALLRANYIGTSAAVVRKTCLEHVGVFDETLRGCEDWDLWIRIARHYRVVLIPESLVAYEHRSEGSFTARYLEWVANHDQIVAKAFASDPGLGPNERRRIEAAVACTKGRICLMAGDEARAEAFFRQSAHLDVRQWRALLYRLVLGAGPMRQLFPVWLKRALRLPA
jgi:glycosyltransferase involved in cell wall biosynthesis